MEKDRLNKFEELERKLKEAEKKLKLADLKSKLESAKRRLGRAGKRIPHDGMILSADDFRMPRERIILYGSLMMCVALSIVLFPIAVFVLPVLIVYTITMVKAKQGQLLGQSVKVSQNRFPEVYQSARIAAHRLEMKMPNVFISFNPFINAYVSNARTSITQV